MISYQLGSTFSIVYIAFRVSIANLSPITDCDEVFNYWEPLHFMLYGTGMQTWEYAPQYALRTYAYLLPMAGVAKLFQFILDILPSSLIHQLSTLLFVSTASATSAASASAASSQNKPLLFAMLRSFLAFASCYSELSFLHAIQIQFPTTTTTTAQHQRTTTTTTTKNINSYKHSNIAHYTALASTTSTGLFHASQAYLPSSSVMILWRMSISNQLMGNDVWAVLWGLVAVLCVGWPFCAVLFLTTGFWTVWKAWKDASTKGGGGLGGTTPIAMASWHHAIKPISLILLRTSIHAILLQSLVMIIDYHFYDRIVSPIWNIFAYNAQSGGDELYGIEPLSYYVKNLLLNFNLVAVLGIVSGPMLVMTEVGRRMFPTWSLSMLFSNNDDDDCGGDNDDNGDGTNHNKRNNHYDDDGDASMDTKTTAMLVLLPMYLWMAIVLPRPHKEERFLFPIYPMLCFGAAITVNQLINLLLQLYHYAFRRSETEKAEGKNDETTTKTTTKTTTTTTSWKRRSLGFYLGMTLLFPSVVLSISRSFALYHYYSAPLMVYRELFHRASSSSKNNNDQRTTTPATSTTTYVCTAGEWYRFPSSFFLPPNHQLGFLKSSFTGQLPQPYTEYGSRQESLLVQGNGKFNDVNEEEMDRYVDIGQCSYVVELVPSARDGDTIPESLQYMEVDESSGGVSSAGSWTQLASYKYLDAESTPLLHRILYLPFGRDGKVVQKGYNLYGREQPI